MKNMIKNTGKRSYTYIRTFIKWTIIAIIIGAVCGMVGTVFHHLVEMATHMQKQHGWLLYFLPLAGIIIVFLYRKLGMSEDGGTNTIISSIRSSEKIPFRMAPLIFIGTVLTHLCGGSSGREGAALQIGGSIGAFIGRGLKLDEKEMHIITMCGMSAVFTALFGTPLTATIFSMEVVSVGVMYYIAFVPCLIASLTALSISKHFGMVPVAFVIGNIPALNLINIFKIVIIAILCATCSILFIVCVHKAGHLYKEKISNPYLRIIAGGFIVIALTAIVGCRDYNGAGMDIIIKAFSENSKPEAFLMKIIFTALTLGAGYKGGEIVPTFFIGATFGNLVGGILGFDCGFSAALGIVALFCSVVNCPITSIMLSIELFGSEGMVLFAIVASISYMLSGYYSLYSSQKIMYSKLRPDFINMDTK